MLVLTNTTVSNGGKLSFSPLSTTQTDPTTGLQEQVPVTLTKLATTSVAIGTLDTSGKNDIVATTDEIGGEILLFQNVVGDTQLSSVNIDGIFYLPSSTTTPDQVIVSGIGSPRDLQLRDLNQAAKVDEDDLDDILYASYSANGAVNVLRNTTQPSTTTSIPDQVTFAAPASYPTPVSYPTSFALGDINQDGVPDLVVASPTANDFAFILGQTQGSFQTPLDSSWISYAYKELLGTAVTSTKLNSYLATLNSDEPVYLSGPNGTMAPLSITPTDSSDLTYDLIFAPLTQDGSYNLVVQKNQLTGNQIKDFIDQNGSFVNLGNVFNQNGSTQYPQDHYSTTIAVNSSDDAQYISGLYHDLLGVSTSTTSTTYTSGTTTRGFVTDLKAIEPYRLQALAPSPRLLSWGRR